MQRHQQFYVSLDTFEDKVRIHISGQNGQTLTLVVDVTAPEPLAMMI